MKHILLFINKENRTKLRGEISCDGVLWLLYEVSKSIIKTFYALQSACMQGNNA